MSTECLIKRFGLTLEEAKDRLFLMPLMSTPMIPVYSSIAVKKGKKTILLIVAFSMAIVSYIMMLFLPTVQGQG
jgi:hypothetical protein